MPSRYQSEILGSATDFHTPDFTNTSTNTNGNVEKRSTKNKDKSVSASTSMSYLNSEVKSKNIFLSKTIGDLKFPSNLDILGSMKTSASKYLLELSNENKEENENECEENFNAKETTEAEGGSMPIKNSNLTSIDCSQTTKDDTFLSCVNENFDNSSINTANQTRSSINDLQLMFDSDGIFFKYCDTRKSWIPVGNCNMQIIVDEMVKGMTLFNLKKLKKNRRESTK